MKFNSAGSMFDHELEFEFRDISNLRQKLFEKTGFNHAEDIKIEGDEVVLSPDLKKAFSELDSSPIRIMRVGFGSDGLEAGELQQQDIDAMGSDFLEHISQNLPVLVVGYIT